MKKLIVFLLFANFVQMLFGQGSQPISSQATIDRLRNELTRTHNDTLQLVLFTQLRYNYFFVNTNLDSALFYSKEVLRIAQKLKYKIDEAYALDLMGDVMNLQHNESTFETFFKGVKIAEEVAIQNKILPRKYLERMLYWENNFTANLVRNQWAPQYFRLEILASLYQDLGRAYGNIMINQQQLFFYLSNSIEIHKAHEDTLPLALDYNTLAEYFLSTNQLDSCLFYAQKAYILQTQKGADFDLAYTLGLIGTIYFKKDNYLEAINLLRQSIQTNLKYATGGNLSYMGGKFRPYLTLSEYFLKMGTIDSSLYYAKKANQEARLPIEVQNTDAMLAKLYKIKDNSDSALKYFELSLALNDSINNADKRRKLQSQDFDEQIHRQEIRTTKIESENRIKVYALLVGLSILIIIGVILYRNNQQRKKTNTLLLKQKEEIQTTLQELKSTQTQLIQQEKMASLGELTAGIAHEIQNPLNFVNNFSEVNTELLDELEEVAAKGNIDEVKVIAKDLRDNEQKILHHGKRADAIVKGMLQHSRASTGKKEPTDINALADEYLHLSYHGMRAKDKTFNATLETDFDNTIEKINIVPQDIARVLLNLYNNAFYALNEKKKLLANSYQPIAKVTTRKLNDKVEIKVKDNGTGIPQKVVDKIFQPFFTTKPTGQGTGLGLSLSYDIIKAHGGEIKVETKEGEGSEFVIQLPA